MKTVSVTHQVLSKWNDKVVIEEIKTYNDPRGSLTELWRTDDEVLNGNYNSKMCYFSYTKPFVMRGPHQHVEQTDYFYTFFSKMSYHLYNPETKEMCVFVTSDDTVTRVKVAPPIIHSYRNLENRVVHTANFPTSLFMGHEKQGYTPEQKIDEIRWESHVQKNKTFVILGAGGRLGSALVESLFDQMNLHDHHVIPVFEKLDRHNYKDILERVEEALIDLESGIIETESVTLINCAAFSNVQKAHENSELVNWVNAELPTLLSQYCEEKDWNCIHFSSDYVYKNSAEDVYTQSKKQMEENLRSYNFTKTTVLRVANLFSEYLFDTHNLVQKFLDVETSSGEITVNPSIVVFPTEVNVLSRFLLQELKNRNSILVESMSSTRMEFINVVPSDTYNLVHFCNKFYDFEIVHENSDVCDEWASSFISPNTKEAKVLFFDGCKTEIERTIKNRRNI